MGGHSETADVFKAFSFMNARFDRSRGASAWFRRHAPIGFDSVGRRRTLRDGSGGEIAATGWIPKSFAIHFSVRIAGGAPRD